MRKISRSSKNWKNYEHIAADIFDHLLAAVPYFNLEIPTELPGVNPGILDPRDTYSDPAEWETKARDLAGRFITNFKQFTDNEEGKALVASGPQL